MLIRSSLLCLTRDQVFLFDVQRSTSGYCTRECKHTYCFGLLKLQPSSTVQSQLEFQQHVRFLAFTHAHFNSACVFKGLLTRGAEGSVYLKFPLQNQQPINGQNYRTLDKQFYTKMQRMQRLHVIEPALHSDCQVKGVHFWWLEEANLHAVVKTG